MGAGEYKQSIDELGVGEINLKDEQVLLNSQFK